MGDLRGKWECACFAEGEKPEMAAMSTGLVCVFQSSEVFGSSSNASQLHHSMSSIVLESKDSGGSEAIPANSGLLSLAREGMLLGSM